MSEGGDNGRHERVLRDLLDRQLELETKLNELKLRSDAVNETLANIKRILMQRREAKYDEITGG